MPRQPLAENDPNPAFSQQLDGSPHGAGPFLHFARQALGDGREFLDVVAGGLLGSRDLSDTPEPCHLLHVR